MRKTTIVLITLICLIGISAAAAALEITGKAAVLLDPYSGRLFLEHNADEQLPVASISKLMTLVLILEAVDRREIDLKDIITASPFAASKRGTRIWLEAGEQFTLNELLYAIAVGSANDAAVAVAEFVAGSEQAFVELMNKRGQELGLTQSVFINCSGLPEDGAHNLMSARDVAALSRHALAVPRLKEYISTYEYMMRPDTTQIPILWNANRLLRRYYGVDGLKTGFTTEAGYCIAATASREHLRLIAVTLGHESEADREREARALLDLGFRKYQSLQLYPENSVVGTLECYNGVPEVVDVTLPQDFYITVERGRELDLTTVISLKPDLSAPLEQGDLVGEITVLYEDEIVGSHPLTIKTAVKKANLAALMFRLSKTLAKTVF